MNLRAMIHKILEVKHIKLFDTVVIKGRCTIVKNGDILAKTFNGKDKYIVKDIGKNVVRVQNEQTKDEILLTQIDDIEVVGKD